MDTNTECDDDELSPDPLAFFIRLIFNYVDPTLRTGLPPYINFLLHLLVEHRQFLQNR